MQTQGPSCIGRYLWFDSCARENEKLEYFSPVITEKRCNPEICPRISSLVTLLEEHGSATAIRQVGKVGDGLSAETVRRFISVEDNHSFFVRSDADGIEAQLIHVDGDKLSGRSEPPFVPLR